MSARVQMRLLGLAMATPPVAWYIYQQGLGALVRVDCGRSGGWTGLLWGLGSIAVCVAVGLAGRASRRPSQDQIQAQTQVFLAILTVSSATVFALAILLQMAATWMIPPCAR